MLWLSLVCTAMVSVSGFAPPAATITNRYHYDLSSSPSFTTTTSSATTPTHLNMASSASSTQQKQLQEEKDALETKIQERLQILYRAADTKQEDSDKVFEALSDLEKLMRQAAKLDDTLATRLQEQLTGSWQLIFTTGTAKTQQQRGGRINYFPLKAIQSFDTTVTPNAIENGIYIGDFCVLQFVGTLDFDLTKRRLNFDFDQLRALNGWLKIPLQPGEAANLGAKSGLGSESNVANAAKKKKSAFFNWISADDRIATARGGGGGLALWKRIDPPQREDE
ncbi:hypothetical protein ACA910_008423 [Epithemia clementina (nom. ined.)]